MASLDKLAIRGIRSFDDKQIAVIEFFNPVTVIVGHNGSGKTTIIECLKYATTGDQPPNTRGGAFVHDPKMANEKEVKAQVKLRFYAANHTRMLAVRNLSVTMKKNGALTMKTLESILALADEKNGKRAAISTKCAEMDAEIPHLLGVSKAVLENVIFCHQEDSYWPLAEPSILKKKFDDIFEATKYTKALDNIKALRKDRMADLKAEKERLESLSKEKGHADKLKTRMSELTGTIASKEMEHGQLQKQYEELVKANARFYESATKFREIYIKVDTLNEKKARYQEELDTARESVKELDGTDQELTDRLRNFDDHMQRQKQKRSMGMSKEQEVDEMLADERKAHAHKQLIEDREATIKQICAKYQIQGFDQTPLERDKVLEFITKLEDLRRRQNTETDKLQDEHNAKSEEYNTKAMRLHTELEGHKQQKSAFRERIATSTARVSEAENEVDQAEALTSQLRALQADMDEKSRRVEKSKTDIKAGNFDQRLSDANAKGRSMEMKRDELTAEIRTLSLQADARARLDLKRAELKSKSSDLNNTLEINNSKFRKLVGIDAHPDTMEREVERVAIEKEREHTDLENETNIASKNLQAAEANLSNLKAQLSTKQKEIQRLDKKIAFELKDAGFSSIESGLKEADYEIDTRKEELGKTAGAQDLYLRLLQVGKGRKCCPLCTRNMSDLELDVYDKNVKENIKKSTPAAIKETKSELAMWEDALKQLQGLQMDDNTRETIQKIEAPKLEAQIKEHDDEMPILTERAEEALRKLNEVKKEIKEISAMRQHATSVSQTQKDIERLKREISSLESELSATGSTKTADDLQQELDELSAEMRANDREKQNLMTERDRLMNALRNHDTELGTMRVRESELKSQIREKTALEGRIKELRSDIASFTNQLKDLDVKIADAQGPIEKLEQQYHEAQRELNAKISRAQRASQDLNMSADKLESINKTIEKYVRERKARRLKECNEKIEEHETEIQRLGLQLEDIRSTIHLIDKEISESGASVANLRENLRIRRLRQDIAATQDEIDLIDLEEAAKAKRIFEEKYNVEKQRETHIQSKYAHIGGELSSLQAQVKTLQTDMKDYKDIGKKYRDQLIKVKMSDMANNDLEKYAKALDNAIMKYHSLKMEEVNDTMRHLWNKTYQGTDIDGIKISSDSEGGATKRSYNYRVVMTKDNVEMDMRGRCSAGQKMLASIIIRLALADSFGQNCGILALDEPTNALDTENIDALAASLVDIINERKGNSSFQLVIITHDENFLRKLGQSNVMEHYW
ncbi:uncharacterized protein FIBRA_05630 [Fibroporia radiculosa]|uniref:DNA repair protein RAD50 n=1 Tax=Fibroporia radiculosa TaxID=599839 RepID=J4IAU0_9APHY|nr:uncharacterized protein FIBRA_05630 [Fibroporia radiculosa]CCM03496.1 predicted protein [Fibroporia radiculosa]